ncbi:MAG: proline--tRNA ligase, partial [Syntrophobacteria bacterium]
AHWCGDPKCEDQIKQDTKATIRCIPIESEDEDGVCVLCGKPSGDRIYFAKAY